MTDFTPSGIAHRKVRREFEDIITNAIAGAKRLAPNGTYGKHRVFIRVGDQRTIIATDMSALALHDHIAYRANGVEIEVRELEQ